jgi:hypothetical protein
MFCELEGNFLFILDPRRLDSDLAESATTWLARRVQSLAYLPLLVAVENAQTAAMRIGQRILAARLRPRTELRMVIVN